MVTTLIEPVLGCMQSLQHCRDTMVGDEGAGGGMRGISGGERKRVTVGVGLVTQPQVATCPTQLLVPPSVSTPGVDSQSGKARPK
jgi:hypothetical protein